MPNTAIQGTYNPFTCTNLNQTLNYSEGNPTLSLTPMVFTASSLNYTRVYTLTMTISAPSQAASVSIVSGVLNNMPFTRVGNVYTLSSQYTLTTGVVVNNWEYFKLAIKNISLAFANSDLGESFTITNSLTDGTSTLTGNITVTTMAQADVTGNIQTINVPMGMNGTSLTTAGGTNVVIADPNQANKTYRVTYTVNDVTNGSGTSNFYLNNSALGQSLLKTFTVSGTQTYINSVIASSGVNNGLYFKNYSPNFYGQSTISYLQEVLTTTEPGVVVPYNQEAGLLTLNTTYTAPFTIGSDPTYTEDSSVTFSLGTITDISADSWSSETCGTGIGVNCFTVTATVTGSFSGTNPVKLTYSGDSSVDDTVTFTGTKSAVNALLASVQLIPPADYIGLLPISVTLTRGNTPVTLFTGTITATCTSTHTEFNTVGSLEFGLGSNTWNVGSITDLATSKSYSATLAFQTAFSAAMSSGGSGGTTSWSPTGGTGGFGLLTITGTKTQVNSHLAAINFTTFGGTTLDSYVNILYTQTQTTNSVSQGTSSIFIGNSINWKAGNGTFNSIPAFVYDQDVAMTWDLASLGPQINGSTSYTVKLVFSTPLSTANLGSVTGWTRETDLIWTKTDVKANLNTALSAVVFVPPAQLVSNFQLDIKIYDGATLVASTSNQGSTKTVFIRQLAGGYWAPPSLTYNQDTVTTWANLFTLNSNFGSGTYLLTLTTSVPTGGLIAGWTPSSATTFTKSDTKANLQTALNSIVFTPSLSLASPFTLNIAASRSSLTVYDSSLAANAKDIYIGVTYAITPTVSTLTYNQDAVTTWTNIATLSANFNGASTYTINILSTNSAVTGSFAGWTAINATNWQKTDTATNLATALSSITFTPVNTAATNTTLIFSAIKSGSTIATSAAKTINIGSTYTVSVDVATKYFQQDTPVTLAGVFAPSALFNNALTYTASISMPTGATITGWTNTDNGTTNVATKTGTGSSLITSLASFQLYPPLSNIAGLTLTLSMIEAGNVVAPVVNKFLTIQSRYWMGIYAKTYQYNTASSITNIGTFVPAGNDNAPYTITATLVSGGTIAGAGWTSTSSTILTATGTKATINGLIMSGFTFTPTTYTTATVRVDFVITKSGVSLLTTSYPGVNPEYLLITCSNPPTVGAPVLPSAAKYMIGNKITNAPIASITNLPADASTYSVTIAAVGSTFNMTLDGSSVTWTKTSNAYGAYDYTTPLLTSSNLTTAVSSVDVTLPSGLTSYNPRIIYTLKSSTGVALSTTGQITMYNAAAIYTNNSTTANVLTQFVTIHCGATLNITKNVNIGSITNPSFNAYNSSITYSLEINTKSTFCSIPGWANPSANLYTMAGDAATISAALTSLPMLFTNTINFYPTFTIYDNTTVMFTAAPFVNTN